MSTETELMKYVLTNDYITQLSWEGNNKEMLLLWLPYDEMEEFVDLFSDYFETENKVMANLQVGNVCIDLVPLFEDELSLEELFPKNVY